ncbi:hypothetical protein AGMMS49992_30140 [Clostridia bacterium]|nr:hypothetical protein AGMMS49992_30140 [Clostridia bacterium]
MITIPYGTFLDAEAVRYCVGRFTRERLPDMKRLNAYYEGEGAISYRVKPYGAPNNRLAHPFARYIVTMASGYLVGAPVAYADNAQPAGLAALMESYRAANADSVDS